MAASFIVSFGKSHTGQFRNTAMVRCILLNNITEHLISTHFHMIRLFQFIAHLNDDSVAYISKATDRQSAQGDTFTKQPNLRCYWQLLNHYTAWLHFIYQNSWHLIPLTDHSDQLLFHSLGLEEGGMCFHCFGPQCCGTNSLYKHFTMYS